MAPRRKTSNKHHASTAQHAHRRSSVKRASSEVSPKYTSDVKFSNSECGEDYDKSFKLAQKKYKLGSGLEIGTREKLQQLPLREIFVRLLHSSLPAQDVYRFDFTQIQSKEELLSRVQEGRQLLASLEPENPPPMLENMLNIDDEQLKEDEKLTVDPPVEGGSSNFRSLSKNSTAASVSFQQYSGGPNRPSVAGVNPLGGANRSGVRMSQDLYSHGVTAGGVRGEVPVTGTGTMQSARERRDAFTKRRHTLTAMHTTGWKLDIDFRNLNSNSNSTSATTATTATTSIQDERKKGGGVASFSRGKTSVFNSHNMAGNPDHAESRINPLSFESDADSDKARIGRQSALTCSPLTLTKVNPSEKPLIYNETQIENIPELFECETPKVNQMSNLHPHDDPFEQGEEDDKADDELFFFPRPPLSEPRSNGTLSPTPPFSRDTPTTPIKHTFITHSFTYPRAPSVKMGQSTTMFPKQVAKGAPSSRNTITTDDGIALNCLNNRPASASWAMPNVATATANQQLNSITAPAPPAVTVPRTPPAVTVPRTPPAVTVPRTPPPDVGLRLGEEFTRGKKLSLQPRPSRIFSPDIYDDEGTMITATGPRSRASRNAKSKAAVKCSITLPHIPDDVEEVEALPFDLDAVSTHEDVGSSMPNG